MSVIQTAEQQAKLDDRNAGRCADFMDVALPELPEIPGMISASDRRYMYWLTSRYYTGIGAVVEVGTWLGRSTIHLAAGLRDAGFDDALHCYDRYEWTKSFTHMTNLPLRKGRSFQPYFEQNVRPIYPNVRVTASTMQSMTWSGDPIEILFLDAPKRLPDISAVLATFGGSLIPGVSIIVLQDYCRFPSFELPTVLDCLGDRLQFVGHHHHMITVPADSTADVQQQPRNVVEYRRDLVRDHFRWMEMASIQTEHFLPRDGVSQIELV